MQSMSLFGGSEMAMLLFFFSGAGVLPLGVPPEKENPVMAYVAPDDCLLYATWAGMAAPNPASPNHTEQLAAEGEVQQLAAAAEKTLAAVMQQSVRGSDDPRAAVMAKSGPIWIRSLVTQPAALYVTRLDPQGRGLAVEGGLIVQAGDSAALLDASLTEILTTDDQKPAEFAIGTRKFHKLAASEEFPVELSWGSGNGYLMVGMGEGALSAMSERIRGQKQPAWLGEIQKAAGIERRSTLSYINMTKAIDLLAPLGGPEGEAVVAALGLRQVTSFGSVTGLDDTGMVGKTLITIDGPPRGLLTLLSGEGVVAGDLAHIPQDALVAGALSFEGSKLFDVLVATASEADPRAAAEISRELEQFEQRTGVNLREALGGLGNNWTVHASTADGGLMSAAITVEVWDKAKVASAQTALMAVVGDSAGGRGAMEFVKTPFAGQTIFHLSPRGYGMPFAPAWCLTDKQLIVGLYPQAVKSILARQAGEKSLADVPQVAAHLAGGNAAAAKPPLAIAYFDSKPLFEATYSSLQVLAPLMSRGFGHRPYDETGRPLPVLFDPAMLPTPRSISRHLQPSVTVVRRTAAGLEIETRQTLPVTNVGAAGPVVAAVLLPAWQMGRATASQVESSNNLKQQLLAMHNFHDTYNTFPGAYNLSKDGKPLLSWRVGLLPFLEQAPLYEEFHHDEPWDSEHNKKLIAKMPKVYKVPGSKVKEGMTSYLGVGGTAGILVKPTRTDADVNYANGVHLASVTDGTSNTLAIVEGADEAAVEWTKPEEWIPNEKDPLKGISKRRPSGFLAACCDGSVHLISLGIDAETLRRLLSRYDGQPATVPDRALPRPR